MIDQAVHPDLAIQRNVMRERCGALGLPLVRCDAQGEIEEAWAPGGCGAIESLQAWLMSSDIGEAMRRGVEAWAQEDLPTPLEVWPGAWAIPMPETHRRRRCGYLVALAFEPDGAHRAPMDPDFVVGACDAQGLRDALASIANHNAESISRLALLLGWSHHDCVEVASKDRALGEFCTQLTECYEEISLLYKLGRSMTELAAPEKFVQQTCDELNATLAFRWIAVRFSDDRRNARHMSGRRIVSGRTPADDAMFEAFLLDAATRVENGSPAALRQDSGLEHWPLDADAHVVAHPVVQNGRLVATLVAGEKEGADAEVSSVDMKLIDAAGGYLTIFLENAALYDEQQAMFVGTLEALTASIDAKDRYTCGHSERVAALAAQLAREIGLDEDMVERVRICGLVHDVGKIGVPESVLCKPGRLTDEEFELIKMHPEIGHRILRDIPQLDDVLPGVLHHHERWDGRGYPHNLAGEDIPLFGRILALADSFDAMSSTRTYRAAMPRAKVIEQIRTGAGSQFDPDLAPRFISLDFSEYDRMVAKHLERDQRPMVSKGEAA